MKIIINVDPDGNTTVETTGVKGSDCTKLTKEIEKALGETVSDKKTREYYEAPATRTNIHEQ